MLVVRSMSKTKTMVAFSIEIQLMFFLPPFGGVCNRVWADQSHDY